MLTRNNLFYEVGFISAVGLIKISWKSIHLKADVLQLRNFIRSALSIFVARNGIVLFTQLTEL